MTNDVFEFEFDDRYRRLLGFIGVRPDTCRVVVGDAGVRVTFGPWKAATDLGNIAGVELSGPYSAIKAIGPRLSLADRGLTFGTTTRQGLCLRFRRPIGPLRHPGLTLTVADPKALMERLLVGSPGSGGP
ncbi:hypothetical protein FDA94_22035 [Herbidospora galbida]|uniref:Uncharacterized protein n=1 Tax=Herbidospora galbida TaxID=2575442 RepID=A0A4U3MAN8_9ACTN|nr:hypothetical protein [Herbidospora galbida]TKK86208.1 hypothetical protein FDA94_22035 [Herbidospora galbida]